ncbi:MAG TPA: type II toxin-antitoxin system HicA family toxin [Terriglobia bacterium]|nr:type II toxin-antitoxin system HicA family toxin [Terriglobia bacterium]
MKLRDLERHLRQNGCVSLREGGSHTVWFNPQRAKIASVPRHKEIKEGTVRAICKQLEIALP